MNSFSDNPPLGTTTTIPRATNSLPALSAKSFHPAIAIIAMDPTKSDLFEKKIENNK